MAEYTTFSEFELLKLLTKSNHAAYTEIYNRYFQLVYVHVCKKIMDEDQAKDIVQELFANLWLNRETALKISNIPAYLITSARNKIFDLFAHQKVTEKHSESLKAFINSYNYAPTDNRIREKQLQIYIEKEIKSLPPKMRLIFEMSRNENFTHKQIADKLETSENNVSTQITSALRILRSKLGIVLLFMLIIKDFWLLIIYH